MEICCKPQGKIPLCRPSKWYNNIKMNLRKTGYKGVKWIKLACNRLQSLVL
jgi:hypothetical protein